MILREHTCSGRCKPAPTSTTTSGDTDRYIRMRRNFGLCNTPHRTLSARRLDWKKCEHSLVCGVFNLGDRLGSLPGTWLR
jgi:hypothetical protein